MRPTLPSFSVVTLTVTSPFARRPLYPPSAPAGTREYVRRPHDTGPAPPVALSRLPTHSGGAARWSPRCAAPWRTSRTSVASEGGAIGRCGSGAAWRAGTTVAPHPAPGRLELCPSTLPGGIADRPARSHDARG